MKILERRISRLEEILAPPVESGLQKRLEVFFLKYGVPSVEDFVKAIKFPLQSDTSESKWLQEILKKGGKAELEELLGLIADFNCESTDESG